MSIALIRYGIVENVAVFGNLKTAGSMLLSIYKIVLSDENNRRKFTRSEVKDLIREVIKENKLDENKLDDSLKKQIYEYKLIS